MKADRRPNEIRNGGERIDAAAELIARALIRLRARSRAMEKLSAEVGLDNPGEPRVYVNTLESPGG
jgi:hypothetical protein